MIRKLLIWLGSMADNKIDIHVNFEEIERYLRYKNYPANVQSKGEKANFRRACKKYSLENEQLLKGGGKVRISKERRLEIICDVHEGLGESAKAKALSSHKGQKLTIEKISKRFFWHNITKDVADYIRTCGTCQKHGTLQSSKPPLHNVPIPPLVFKQIWVDISNLHEVDGYVQIIVAIDYISKWSEAKLIMEHSTPTVACFLYELICRHGCFSTQINDQGREFVNAVTDNLHKTTGAEQRITSVYHPKANRLCERQNRTIQNSLEKVLEENSEQWPYVLEGILFVHRVSRHSSTGFSPFRLLYNRELVLPVELTFNLVHDGQVGDDGPFDMETFNSVLTSSQSIRTQIHKQAGENIENAQKKQMKYYDRRFSQISSSIKTGDKVLLKKQ